MLSISKFYAAPLFIAVLCCAGCEDAATPPTPQEEAKHIQDQQAAMDRYYASLKEGAKGARNPSPKK